MTQSFAITVAAILSTLIWLYLLLGRGRFWQIQSVILPSAPAETTARIAVVIPARNEADVVAQTVTSLLQQNWSGTLHVFLIDDDSNDATAEVARGAADRAGQSQHLTIIAGKPLPAGWSGKLWALQQGIERAIELGPEFLLLTDADVVHASNSVSALVATARAGAYDLT